MQKAIIINVNSCLLYIRGDITSVDNSTKMWPMKENNYTLISLTNVKIEFFFLLKYPHQNNSNKWVVFGFLTEPLTLFIDGFWFFRFIIIIIIYHWYSLKFSYKITLWRWVMWAYDTSWHTRRWRIIVVLPYKFKFTRLKMYYHARTKVSSVMYLIRLACFHNQWKVELYVIIN